MRVDVFTSQERANEAAAMYRNEQFGKFLAWCTGGSVIIGLFLVFCLMYRFPDYFELHGKLAGANPHNFSIDEPGKIARYIFTFPLLLIASPIILIVGGIFFGLFFIGSFLFARLVSIYQGLFYALISFFISWGIFWAMLNILGLNSADTVSIIIAGVICFIAFLLGIFGVFLPDV